MDFFQYRTAYEFHHRQGHADGPPEQVYRRWQAGLSDPKRLVADRLRNEAKGVFYEAESQWYAADRPYYKIWPGVIPLLANVNVEVACEFLRLPFKCFSVRLPKLENPLRFEAEKVVQSYLLYEHSVAEGGRRLSLLLDAGEVAPKGTPRIVLWHVNCAAGQTLDSLFDPAWAQVNELGKGSPLHDLGAQCFRIAISVCFLATGGDKLVEPEVLSKDLARYLEARRMNEATLAERLIAKARRSGKHGWNVGEYERLRPLVARDPHDGNAEGGHHAALSHQHQRQAHFRLLANGKVTFVRQTTVRPDLPPPIDRRATTSSLDLARVMAQHGDEIEQAMKSKKRTLSTPLRSWTGPFDPPLPAAILKALVAKLSGLSAQDLRQTYALTALQARRARAIVERARLGCSGAPASGRAAAQAWRKCEARFADVVRRLERQSHSPDMLRPLMDWRVPGDVSLPRLARLSVVEVAANPFVYFQNKRGFGLGKMRMVVELLSRAAEPRANAGFKAFVGNAAENTSWASSKRTETPPAEPPRVPPAVEIWLEHALEHEAPILVTQINRELVRPLLRVVEVTNGKRAARFAAGRLRLHGPPATLEAMGKRAGLTRERVRQILAKVTKTMKSTWPAGLERVAALHERARFPTVKSAEARLLRKAMRLFWGRKPDELNLLTATDNLRQRVIRWWQRQVRLRRTQMTDLQFRSALSTGFPMVGLDLLETWLAEQMLTWHEPGGKMWHFGRAGLDPLLLEVRRASEPLPLGKAASLLGTTPDLLRPRIDRDLRFMLCAGDLPGSPRDHVVARAASWSDSREAL